jgi:hypothetical protein
VRVAQSNGLPVRDGTKVFLQLAEGRFRPSIGQSVLDCEVKNGVAIFHGVGLDTSIAVATWDPLAKEYVEDSFHGPLNPRDEILAHLTLSGPRPEVMLRIQGEDIRRNQRFTGTLNWRLNPHGIYGGPIQCVVNPIGLAPVKLSRKLSESKVALLTVVKSSSEPSVPSELRVGLRLLFDKTLSGGFKEWTVPFATDVIISGRVVDLDDKPYEGCPLRLVVTEAVFKVPRERLYVGRLLVDQPAYLSQLSIGYSAAGDGPFFFSRSDGRINSSDGSFQVWPNHRAGHDLIVSSRVTGEAVAVLAWRGSVAKKEGSVWRLPEWDLRGKIFEHHVRVRNSDGKSPGELAVSLPTIAEEHVLFTDPILEFLSPSPQMLLYINAVGYREQKVMSIGRVEVEFDPPLPKYHGVQWRVAAVRSERPVGLEQLVWHKIRGEGVKIMMPAVGDYGLFLGSIYDPTAAEISEEENQITITFNQDQYASAVKAMWDYLEKNAQFHDD